MEIKKTHFRILLLTAAAVLTTGCATVNVTEMAGPSVAKAEAPAEKNIVLRTAEKLYAAFRSKGFVAKTSRNKLQSAASILLHGLEEREITSDVSYAERNLPRSVVIEDIAFATQEVRRTSNAAEIYFDLSEGDRKLREELSELEQALLVSREASQSFEDVLGSGGAELRGLDVEIDRLKAVTDNFGRRVREQAASDLAARRGKAT